MSKLTRSYIFLSMIICSCISAGIPKDNHNQKMYVDYKEVDMEQDRFCIHIGENVWIQTTTMHRDETGMYTFECNIIPSSEDPLDAAGYDKRWRCPYCHYLWPIGVPCKNKECPSKYKE